MGKKKDPTNPFDGFEDLLDPHGAITRDIERQMIASKYQGATATDSMSDYFKVAKALDEQMRAAKPIDTDISITDPYSEISRKLDQLINPAKFLHTSITDEYFQPVGAYFYRPLGLIEIEALISRYQRAKELSQSGAEREENKDSAQEAEDAPEENSSWSLIKVVSASALRRLEAVDLFPITDILELLRNPQLMHQLHHRDFEKLTAELLSGLGYQVSLTGKSGDGGIDVYATKEVNGIPIILGCECKQYSESNKIGAGTVRTLLGSIGQSNVQATIGVLVTTSTFTKGARQLIGAEATLDGKDFFGVVDWIKEYSHRRP